MTRSAAYPGKLRGDFASLKRAGIPGAGDYHGPGTTAVMPGLRMARYRCACGAEQEATYTVVASLLLPCDRCHRMTDQERVL